MQSEDAFLLRESQRCCASRIVAQNFPSLCGRYIFVKTRVKSIRDLFSRHAHQVGELSCKHQPLYSRVGGQISLRGHVRCPESGRTTGCRRIHVNVPSGIYSRTPLALHSTAQPVPKLEAVSRDIVWGGIERLSQE